jgi:hypothetical protein
MHIESFNWVVDANQDGTISLPETWETAKWLYQLPGNLVVEAIGHIPHVADLFHIHASQATGYSSFNSWFTSAFALLFWLFILVEASNLQALLLAGRAGKPAQGKPRWRRPGF